MEEKYDVTGMTCAACSARVEKCVAELKGVDSVSVNLLKNSMVVKYDDKQLNSSQISEAVAKAGYGAKPQTAKGAYILSCTITATMSPGVKINTKELGRGKE